MKCCGHEQDTPFCGWCGALLRQHLERRDDGPAKIYGYVRVSSYVQKGSLGSQHELVEKKCKQIEVDTEAKYRKTYPEQESAYKVRFNKRPIFSKLLRMLEPGDHLVVWRLNRLERRLEGLYDCVRILVRRGVHVHSIQESTGAAFDLNSLTGKVFLYVMAIAVEIESEGRREEMRRMIFSLRDQGYAYYRFCPLGKTRIRVKGHDGRMHSKDVWHPGELARVYYCWRKWKSGTVSLEQIAREVYNQGWRTPKGYLGDRPWVRLRRKGKYRGRKLQSGRLYNAIHEFDKRLKEEFGEASPEYAERLIRSLLAEDNRQPSGAGLSLS